MPASARASRSSAVNALKRELIREAAKRVFVARGLSSASVREIAQQAGYTTGAIYFHYAGKEEIYADVLRESLAALHDAVASATAAEKKPVEALVAAYRAFIAFYRAKPQDLSLGLYLFEGAGPRGLSPALNRDLNAHFLGVMQVFEAGLLSAGVPKRECRPEAVAIFNEMIGLLIAANTGRLAVFGVDVGAMTERHLAGLRTRVAKLTRPEVLVASPRRRRMRKRK